MHGLGLDAGRILPFTRDNQYLLDKTRLGECRFDQFGIDVLSAREDYEEFLPSGDKEISKELDDLIKLIVEKNEVKTPKMVAKAYLALVEKLGVPLCVQR